MAKHPTPPTSNLRNSYLLPILTAVLLAAAISFHQAYISPSTSNPFSTHKTNDDETLESLLNRLAKDPNNSAIHSKLGSKYGPFGDILDVERSTYHLLQCIELDSIDIKDITHPSKGSKKKTGGIHILAQKCAVDLAISLEYGVYYNETWLYDSYNILYDSEKEVKEKMAGNHQQNILKILEIAVEYNPTGKEALYQLAKWYRLGTAEHKKCIDAADKAMKATLVNIDGVREFNSTELKKQDRLLTFMAMEEICVCGYYADWQQFRGMGTCLALDQVLGDMAPKSGTDEYAVLQRTRRNMEYYISLFKPKLIPESERAKNSGKKFNAHFGRIAVAFTTAQRPHLFKRAYSSFKMRCADCDLVESWFVADDFSEPEQIEAMQQFAPPCTTTWLQKNKSEKGHVGSLNSILKAVLNDYDYLVLVEDDWFFFKDEYFIFKALQIFNEDAHIAQVVFNQDYLTTNLRYERDTCTRGASRVTEHGIPYVDQLYKGDWSDPKMEAFRESLGSNWTFYHWPHFSLQPSIWRLSAFRTLEAFENREGFEVVYAYNYTMRGWRTSFLPGSRSIHLAQSVYLAERAAGSVDAMNDLYDAYGFNGLEIEHVASAYDLGNTLR